MNPAGGVIRRHTTNNFFYFNDLSDDRMMAAKRLASLIAHSHLSHSNFLISHQNRIWGHNQHATIDSPVSITLPV
jgi:hypothetical protein